MAWTEDGWERHVLEPRRALRERMAEMLIRYADDNQAQPPHKLRQAAEVLSRAGNVG